MPYVEIHAKSVNRVNLVCDHYFDDFDGSLKSLTRSNRGRSIRENVTSNSLIPDNRAKSTFLRCSENKLEMFRVFSNHITQKVSGEKLYNLS